MEQTETTKLLEQIEQWNEDDEFSKCIEAIEAIAENERGYELTLKLSRAYSNLAVLGDNNIHDDDGKVDEELISYAIKLLESIRSQGETDPYWNARMGYSHLMADDSAATAYEYAKRWLALEPENPDAQKLVRDCEGYLEEEKALARDLKERAEIMRRETPDDDILGHVLLHIEKYFGGFVKAIHDDHDPKYPIDIVIIPPRMEFNYYTLVTVGLSLYKMNVPEDLAEQKLERAELLINLPKDWDLSKAAQDDEKWFWPIHMLLATAHFALQNPEVWLATQQTLMDGENGVPFAHNTKLCGEILLFPGVFGENSFVCQVPNGEEVNFYQVIPLYKEEVHYKIANGAGAFLDLCPDEILEVINPTRLNAAPDAEQIAYASANMADAEVHLKKIRQLKLPVDELAAYNHMAIFLYWCIKNDRMSNPFIWQYKDILEAVKQGECPDLRLFIRDSLAGKTSTQHLDRQGSAFAQWYNQNNRSNPYVYLRDYRDYAHGCLQGHVYNTLEEKEAAYLLLPFSQLNCKVIEKLIDKRFKEFLANEFENDPQERIAYAAEGKPQVIADWQGALYCYSSERIALDGCPVRYMARIMPQQEEMGWESGWIFFSGDEGEVYSEGNDYYEDRCGFYDIRDICRIDPNIALFLELPYGTAWMQDDEGKWHELIDEDEQGGIVNGQRNDQYLS